MISQRSMRIGAHMSAAGGVALAVDRARLHGCEALQIFTRNPNQWQAAPLAAEQIRAFRTAVENSGIGPVVSHASYLINLASALPGLRAQALTACGEELDRAEALGLRGVVLHPGTHTSGTEDEALHLIADGIRSLLATRRRARTMVLLEHTAGQGNTLGHRFEHLASILERLDGSPRVGICLDTCHLVAAGYDIITEAGYRETFERFDRLIGWSRLAVVHANDSKRPLGSRVDRHEHVGDGYLGLAPFWRLLHDTRAGGLPLLLETAKSAGSERAGRVALDANDVRNLTTLRRLRDERQAPGIAT